MANGLEFVSLAYYAPRQVTSRLVALLDPQAARERTGTDSIELDIEVLQRYLPIAVQTYEAFEASTREVPALRDAGPRRMVAGAPAARRLHAANARRRREPGAV